MTISIVNYGVSNLGSIVNMLKKIGVSTNIVSSKDDIEKAKKLILPGVGSFDNGVSSLKSLKIFDAIKIAANKDVPILGICLGMQLLGEESEEGKEEGLGLIPGKTIRFNLNDQNLKVPHMGWNEIKPSKVSNLLENLDNNSRFYFVHSYHFETKIETNSLAKTNYGIEFNSIIQHKNVYGTQFHPEKSHKFGIQLLKNFSNI
tara:strand:- start:269 stop:877 length:609 start_codon:yes stop_codon:yes gene_type:complete